MSEDNNKKDDKEFSFIQEQITSKKKSKFKRMLFSVVWTITLAGIFGIVAGVAFCVSEPTISNFLGKQQGKKTVEFPTASPEGPNQDKPGSLSPTPSITVDGEEQDGDGQDSDVDTNNGNVANGDSEIDSQNGQHNAVDSEPDKVVIEKVIKADLADLTSIYTDLREISDKVSSSLVTVTSTHSGVSAFENEIESTKTTTGLVVANNEADLLILVSLDKIKDAKDIQVTFADDFQIEAKMQAYDKDLNLAILAIELVNIPYNNLINIKAATLGESYSLIIGTPIMALGCPNGYVGSMELGIIASKGYNVYITDNKIDLFNTDINYNENSDGIIVNLSGEVIGIITNELKDESNEELNTVIGISRIKKIIESLVNNTDRIYFGIKGADMTEAAMKEVEINNGIFITEVEADSPALEAGLQSGDIILAVNDTPLMSVNTFNSILSIYKPKTSVKVTILRSTKDSYKDMEIDVTLAKKND